MKKEKQFLTDFSSILDEQVTSFETKLKEFQNWDSVNILRIIKHFEMIHGRKFRVLSFLKSETVEDLFQTIYEHESLLL